ncbi:MAG TPA: Crp/Fnr family transcriptional regulator [Ferruginibacter sp.]|nr:Crp/Fnr family transcriptional regulator [Ferruginibacter sp.]
MIDIDTLLAWGASFKKIAAGEVIFHEETSSRYYYQLVSGSLRWVNIYDDGREFLQGIISPGESFGELPLFDNEKYAASAIADSDSVIIRLYKPLFIELIKKNPDIHFAFSRLLAERLRFKFLLLKEMANHNPEQNISSLLDYFKVTKKNMSIGCNRVNLTRQQIADMTGMRVETVIRAIRALQEKGRLVIDKGKVYC